jgi:excisionase family DNA binding protein
MTARWLRISEASKYASLSPKTVKRMLLDGLFNGERTPGGHWRVDRESIDSWFSRGTTKAVAILESLKV